MKIQGKQLEDYMEDADDYKYRQKNIKKFKDPDKIPHKKK